MDNAVHYRSLIGVYILTVFVRHGVSKLSDASVVNKNTGKNDEFSIDAEELLQRRRIVDLYLSEYVSTKENWIETYHLNFKAGELDSLDQPKLNSASDKTELDRSLNPTLYVDTKEKWIKKYPLNFKVSEPESLDQPKLSPISDKTELDRSLKPTFSDIKGKVIESKSFASEQSAKICKEPINVECVRERLYFFRWLKKLLSKFDNPYKEYNSISILFSSDSLKSLKELLSLESFDIIKADEIIFNLISNATTNDNYYYSWISYVPSNEYLLQYATIILTIVVFLYCLMNRPLYAVGLLIILSCVWHSVNMKQKLTAQKHATLSRISPAYCVNTLTEESGVFSHIKQYFIDYVYAEDCKKYYDALMVDPTSEINMLSVIVNFVVTVFLEIFQALGPVLNNFVKEVLYNTTFTHKIFVIFMFIFMFFIILLFFKYKIKLPFYLGSFEPTVIPVGSHAEDLKFSKRDNLTVKNSFSENVDTPALNARNVSKVASSHNKDNISCTKFISSKLQHAQPDNMNYEACNEIEEVKPFNLLDQGKEICTPKDDANEICIFIKESSTCSSRQLQIKIDEKKLSVIKNPLLEE